MLDVRGLAVRYGRNEALADASIHVAHGEIVALIGANGAGKSSLLKAITGIESCAAGAVMFNDVDVTRLSAPQRVAFGMALAPEGRGIFGELTVRENLDLGAFLRRGRDHRAAVASDLALVFTLFPRLGERHHQRAGTLSGGEQQMLAIGRALMTAPKLLVLDEPSLGLAPRVLDEIVAALRALHASRGLSILVAEQNAVLGLDMADRGYVLHHGHVVLDGSASDLAGKGGLIDYYLGSALDKHEKENI